MSKKITKVLVVFCTRSEAIKVGLIKLVGTNSKSIFKETQNLLDNKSEYDKMLKAANPYGDGKASERIVAVLKGL